MKKITLSAGLSTFVFLISQLAQAGVVWKSVYTNIEQDCVEISKSNSTSEIDFSDFECKSFGGYRLSISGGDLRYAPKLEFVSGLKIDLKNPSAFHDMGSKNIEWVYTLSQTSDGVGQIKWRGLVYRLSVSNGNGTNSAKLYAVRLDGPYTCPLGVAASNTEARKMIETSKAGCN
jgi:hypothetical protein